MNQDSQSAAKKPTRNHDETRPSLTEAQMINCVSVTLSIYKTTKRPVNSASVCVCVCLSCWLQFSCEKNDMSYCVETEFLNLMQFTTTFLNN